MTARAWHAVLAGMLLALPGFAHAQMSQQQAVDQVAFEQHIGARLPGRIELVGADGAPSRLSALTDDRAALLVMVWFDCPDLCPLTLDRLAAAAGELPFSSDEYRILVVGIDPNDGPDDARRLRTRLARSAPDASFDNWRFLSGGQPAIDRLATTIGFRYAYDAERERFAHPAGLTVLEAGGRINRYLLGVHPEPRDLKLALLDAGRGELGSPVDQALLRCYRYDPQTGRYGLAVMNIVRGAGAISILALAGFVIRLRRRERH